jgi:hypothetical protein
MSDESKYWYIAQIPALYFSKRTPRLEKWNPNFSVEVDENVDFRQYVSILIDKLSQKSIPKTKSTEFEKARPVIKEIFLKHYSLAVTYIAEELIDEGEFYLNQRSKDWFQIAYFSKDEKPKKSIEIDFRDGIDDLSLTIDSRQGHKGRPEFRKKGKAIPIDKFKQFLNLNLQFLYDSDSLLIFLEDYVKNFYNLVGEKTSIDGFIISAEKQFSNILEQLKSRKNYIEKHLIEVDTDSNIDRAKFRGELDGIEYAIKTIMSKGVFVSSKNETR